MVPECLTVSGFLRPRNNDTKSRLKQKQAFIKKTIHMYSLKISDIQHSFIEVSETQKSQAHKQKRKIMFNPDQINKLFVHPVTHKIIQNARRTKL